MSLSGAVPVPSSPCASGRSSSRSSALGLQAASDRDPIRVRTLVRTQQLTLSLCHLNSIQARLECSDNCQMQACLKDAMIDAALTLSALCFSLFCSAFGHFFSFCRADRPALLDMTHEPHAYVLGKRSELKSHPVAPAASTPSASTAASPAPLVPPDASTSSPSSSAIELRVGLHYGPPQHPSYAGWDTNVILTLRSLRLLMACGWLNFLLDYLHTMLADLHAFNSRRKLRGALPPPVPLSASAPSSFSLFKYHFLLVNPLLLFPPSVHSSSPKSSSSSTQQQRQQQRMHLIADVGQISLSNSFGIHQLTVSAASGNANADAPADMPGTSSATSNACRDAKECEVKEADNPQPQSLMKTSLRFECLPFFPGSYFCAAG